MNKYICDDRELSKEYLELIANMTDEEFEKVCEDHKDDEE